MIASAPLIRTEKLTHVYSAGTPFERVAIKDIDFSVRKGEYLGIIGSTGSGKSTFIQHLNGLLRPTTGQVYFDGVDIHKSKEITRATRFKVGLVFQYPEYQLFESTLYDDIAFGPKNMGLIEPQVRDRVHEAAGFAGLREQHLQKSPFELSGGEKRRAAIAGVIAMRPEVLILDEPTAGLDPRGRDEIIRNVMDYKDAHGATVIMVTHNMEEIARSVGRITLFDMGQIVGDGTPEQVFSDPGRLSDLGLSAPKAAMVAQRLRALGVPISQGIYTTEKLRSALKGIRTRNGDAEANADAEADADADAEGECYA